jgi:4-hydroxy-tetrahydrodipicolinate synthase
MTQDGKIRYDVFETLIEYQIQSGTAALIVCGSTGESVSLTDVEYASCVRFVVEAAAGRIPVLVGSGSISTAQTVERSCLAQELGADALLVVTPPYIRAPQSGLIRHFLTVADAVDLPVVLYHVPSRTACTLTPETNRILSQHPNIVALKEADTDLRNFVRTRALCGDDLAIYAGNDELIAPAIALGGIGAISVAANLCPKEIALLCGNGLAGNLDEMKRRQLVLAPLLKALSCETNPIPIKAALRMAGLPVGPCRSPLDELTEGQATLLRDTMTQMGIGEGVFS